MTLATLIIYSAYVSDFRTFEQRDAREVVWFFGILLWALGNVIHYKALATQDETLALRSFVFGIFGMAVGVAWQLTRPQPRFWVEYLIHASWPMYVGMVLGVLIHRSNGEVEITTDDGG